MVIPDPDIFLFRILGSKKYWIPDLNPLQWLSQCFRSGRIIPDPDAGFSLPAIAYSHHLNANTDQSFHVNANPDTIFHYKSDKPSTAPV